MQVSLPNTVKCSIDTVMLAKHERQKSLSRRNNFVRQDFIDVLSIEGQLSTCLVNRVAKGQAPIHVMNEIRLMPKFVPIHCT